MGLFSGSKEIFVSSVVYNMAGPEEFRPDYLRSLVTRHVLSGTKETISTSLTDGLIHGPAMKYRSFYRWAGQPGKYDLIGMPTGSLMASNAVDTSVVQTYLENTLGIDIWVQKSELAGADYGLWVEQYLLANNPSAIGTDWTADINTAGTLITITYEDTTQVSFVPVNYAQSGRYLYSWYNEVETPSTDSVITGSWSNIGASDFPSTTGWTLTSTTVTGTQTETTYTRVTHDTSDPEQTITLQEWMYRIEETSPTLDRQYRVDTQMSYGAAHHQIQLHIYKMGSGVTDLDALESGSSFGEFLPFIPVRINNNFLSDSFYPDEYAQAKKAYKRVTGKTLDSFITKLEDNPNLADIDYAYITFGVSLNTIENSSREYIYQFLKRLQLSQIGGPSIYNLWLAEMADQSTTAGIWNTWRLAQSDPGNALFGTAEPARPTSMSTTLNEVRISGSSPSLPTNFDMRLTWYAISNGSGTGLGKPDAKAGDVWFDAGTQDSFGVTIYGGGALGTAGEDAVDRLLVYRQTDATNYTWLEVRGLTHHNYVYGGKVVITTAAEALADTDESGFIIPLHYDVWRTTSLVDSNQMGTACVYAVFNSYTIKKTKWYESGVFSIILVIVFAIVSAVFTGGTSIGLLGSALSVGSTFGLTGISAAIVGSIANSLAALVVITILETFTTRIFGPEIGGIIAALSMLVVGNIASSGGLMSGTLALNWESLLKIDNLMSLTNAIGNSFTANINTGTLEIGQQMQDLARSTKLESEKIQQAYFKEFGYGAGRIDPMMFVADANSQRIINESPNTFLTRTLMTGSEIAELSNDLLNNFSRYSTKLPDAFT